MTVVTPATAPGYLERNGLIGETGGVTARTLGGGVSNRVVQVSGDGECYVLKQPLENLDVEDDWPADPVRIHNEAAAARAYGDILERINRVFVPEVVFENERDHVAVFGCAPPDAVTWKRHLLDGRVETGIAALVGDVLGTVHLEADTVDGLREQFADDSPFEQLRLDPYHRTVAQRHPEVADAIGDELDRIRDVDRTLVHGDYSPKNVLVTDDHDVWILYFEVAHWGDPAFDVAYMLNHLFIKSVHNAEKHSAYVLAAHRFCSRVRWDVERETIRELAILMLARVDGKSPVEHVDEPTAEALRSAALEAIWTGVETIDAFTTLTDEAAEQR